MIPSPHVARCAAERQRHALAEVERAHLLALAAAAPAPDGERRPAGPGSGSGRACGSTPSPCPTARPNSEHRPARRHAGSPR